MKYDLDKVDDMTLALLYLVSSQQEKGLGVRAWKGFDWETMNRLHEKGLISNPKTKAMSIVVTDEGYKRSEELFRNYFGQKE